MTWKPLIFVSLLVASMSIPMADAQLGLISGLLGLIHVQRTVFCTANGNMGANGAATPAFANAIVQLLCGGKVISNATTNGSGVFSIVLHPVNFVVSSLLNTCNLKVDTPLSTCNSTMPSVGALLSSLQFIGNNLMGLLNVANIVPSRFRFLPST